MPGHILKEKHDHEPLVFPEGFLWGSATSAHQVEGNNVNSDWWAWEQTREKKYRSGEACDQYNRYLEDFNIAKTLNHNSHRLSIEWARVEPKEGEFDEEVIDHYIQVLKSLKERQMKVMLTLWHFTLPKWVADKGGWENSQTVNLFLRFVQRVVPEMKPYVDFWISLNEPSVYTFMAYIQGSWPPQKKSNLAAWKATWNLAQAHKKAYRLVHKLDHGAHVGIAHNIQTFEAYHKHSLIELLAVGFGDLLTNHLFYFLTQKTHDFLGINYYFHHRFDKLEGLLPDVVDVSKQYRDVSDLGWEVYPEGIFEVLTDLADHIPIYITECGIASTNDDRRTRFLISYLQEVYQAIRLKIPVKGFFYWSLLDNFEWHQGFEPRFGLVEIDYETQKRTIRPSAYVYAQIIKENAIPHKIMKLMGHTVQAKEVLCQMHDGPKAFCEHTTSSRFPHHSMGIEFKKRK